jgi:tetratricopeptide (TPR) repeat protein/cold shock CspA family protein
MADLESILADVRALANRGDHQAIVARYGSLEDTPADDTWHSSELLFEIGRAFGMLGNEDKLERYLLRCAELAPRRAAVFHCSIGWYFQRKKKWTKALRWYDRALQSFPTYHLCLFRRGYCLEKLHRPREAAEALARARVVWDEAAPDQRQRGLGVQVQVLFHLSRALRDLGEFDAAAGALEVCQTLDARTEPPAIRPEHLLACRGELELRRADFDAALTSFESARDLDPSSSYVWERLGRVRELRGESAAAEAAYRHATTLPRGAFAFFALGRFHLHVTHDLPAAVVALVEALKRLRSAEPLIRLELARLELEARRPASAFVQVQRALACRREGGFTEALRLAAEIAEQLGRFAEAAHYLRQLARVAPDDAAVAARAAELERRAPTVAEPPPDAPLPPELSLLEEATLNTPGRTRVTGIVDRFFADKGFGFLRYGDGLTLFFHVTQCEGPPTWITPGVHVSFVVGHNPKKGKPQAEDVQRVE